MGRAKLRNWEELEKNCIDLYRQGMYQKDICKKLNVNSHLVGKWLKEAFPEIKRFKGYRKNTFNEHYFKKIDSASKAYFLGLLYADGNIYLKRRRMQIGLQLGDSYILERFARELNFIGKLYKDRNRLVKLILDSSILSSDLINAGCVPNKTSILKFPTEDILPKDLESHFIRGFFDGDGGISANDKYLNITFTATEAFLEVLSIKLSKLGIHSSRFRKRYKTQTASSGDICINRRSSQKILNKYIYKDCGEFFLTRKKEKFRILENSQILRKSRYD